MKTSSALSAMKGLSPRANTVSLLAYIAVFALLWGLLVHRPVLAQIIEGDFAVCENEGEKIDLPMIANDPCITCFCKGRHIVCERESCHSNQGCYMVLFDQKRRCCSICKGCIYNNTSYDSGSRWTNPEDPCQTYHCQASVVTVSQQQCYTPCKNPQPPPVGHCCPSCKGCKLSGMSFRDGDEFVLEDDRCVRCKCHNGSLVCFKQACPVLSCPASKVIHKTNTCCPECKGSREVYEVKQRCYLNKFYMQGDKFKVDNCTSCTCNGSTSICARESCLPLPCTLDLQVVPKGECCPQCIRQEVVSVCSVAGHKYKDGETWKPNSCTTCDCWRGKPRCLVDQCNRELKCPLGHKVSLQPGNCCPKCIEEDGVCTVFGDPHYRTFDRRLFDFQGPCKYVLTEDCISHSFTIRVRNEARTSRAYSWTKAIFVKINNTKVVLLQQMKVKVDGQQIKMPYTKQGVLSVTQEEFSVTLKTDLGFTLLWNGDSFLEVSVPPSFHGKLCGLCGNFNNDSSDDFKTRRGQTVSNPVTFGRSWRVGGKSHCGRSSSSHSQKEACRWDSFAQGEHTCGALKMAAFQPCHQVVSIHRYLRSCILDMCECPTNKSCYCDSLMAYAHECSRNGVTLHWRNATNCGGAYCRRGTVFNQCGPPCPLTCQNKDGGTPCPSTQCVSGCHCPKGTVLHKRRCIKPEKCPLIT